MTPIPRFHPTKTSGQAPTTAKQDLIPPPRELKTLTIGCKIGFILVYPRYHLANWDIEETAKTIVRNALASTSFIGDVCNICEADHEYTLPVSLKHLDENHADRNKYWKVDINPDAHLHDEEFMALSDRYFVVGIQIISRVFRFYNKTYCPGDKFASPIDGDWLYHDHHGRRAQCHWNTEVRAVDQALKTLSVKPNYRVLTNEFTDFKVHVGNNHRGVHMDIARSLMAIFTAFERQFDAINTTPRIGGGVRGQPAPVAIRPKFGYQYASDDFDTIQEEAGEVCKPMSSVNMSYLKISGMDCGYDIVTFLRIFLKGNLDRVGLQKFLENDLISHRNTLLDVSRVWDDKLIAYNPSYVTDYCMKTPTVASRSHAGTLDSNDQIAWMDLCCLLVEYCYMEDLREVESWTRTHWSDPHNRYTILDVLEHVDGYNWDTFAHYEKIAVPFADPESRIEQPYIPHITAESAAEKLHSDHLKSTGVPTDILVRNADYKRAQHVREKIKHKFDMGLYGKFPEETVLAFIRDHHDKKAVLKKGWQDLVLRTD
ncbi:hypothetical protein M436DRAFT_57397 [Aureobasidium namibiae CBS 147.97]|uniref:Uncharacterized protein n=1 Tax=Aureobasidium namibiae CBS 147.97 TaxID=1043004 RepID=A0A074W7N5_9PEZI